MSLVYLILGGNQGNRTEIISAAIDLVTNKIGEKIAESECYESESWGFESELFVNQVIIINTTLSPLEVLEETQSIERQLGRMRKISGYEARSIDIDLLYYDSEVITINQLVLPHPRIADRKFVLVPLAEVAPNLTDPLSGKTVQTMLAECSDESGVWLLDSK